MEIQVKYFERVNQKKITFTLAHGPNCFGCCNRQNFKDKHKSEETRFYINVGSSAASYFGEVSA